MDLGLSGRTYLVSGGSRGLGYATAETLVDGGASVVLAGRNESSLQAAVARLEERASTTFEGFEGTGGPASYVVADLADPGTPQRLIDAAHETHARLDGGLISVGGPAAGTVLTATDEQWTAAFESVFLGAVRLARTLAVALADDDGADQGSIVLVLSSSVKNPVANLAISNGLRPGLAMVVKSLADEIGPRGVRVNALLPGRLDTERVRELDALSGDVENARAANQASIPLRRYGRPQEFGMAGAFLLSPASSYITGTMLPVDGGLLRAL